LEFTLRGSQFSVRVHVRFEVRGSRFEVRGSRFEVRGSTFGVRVTANSPNLSSSADHALQYLARAGGIPYRTEGERALLEFSSLMLQRFRERLPLIARSLFLNTISEIPCRPWADSTWSTEPEPRTANREPRTANREPNLNTNREP